MAPAPERSHDKKIEILKSAAAAFRRKGYHGASMGEISRAVGMTKGNLYYYFRNKEAILFFCHQYSLSILLTRLREVQASRARADVKLRRLIVAFVHMIVDELHGTALTMDLSALEPPHLETVIAQRDLFDRGLRRIVEQGMKAGTFAKGDPKLLTFAILGASNWITRWYDPAGSAGSDEIAETFADYLLAGLRGGAAGRGRLARPSARGPKAVVA
jgi:AcrR family transcriptional regulator